MAFQSGDVRGTKTAVEAKHAHKQRPYNMLERSQNVPNNKTRVSWDRMFLHPSCPKCPEYSSIIGKCMARKVDHNNCEVYIEHLHDREAARVWPGDVRV